VEVTQATRLDLLQLESAGEQVVARVPVVGPDDSMEAVRATLLSQRFDSAVDIAVCEDGRLRGVIRIEDALAAPAAARARDVMDAEPPVVAPGTDRERAAWQAVRHGEGSLAVVDEGGRFLGLVPPPRLLSVLLWEHDEDMARLGGFLHDVESARTASEEAVARRFWHRLPWLLVGLLGAMLAASIVDAFEEELAANVVLAFFIPGIVYMADAVGTQTETLVIRGLSVGVPIRHVVRREAVTGVLVGLSIAVLFYPFALVYWGEGDIALAASLALLAACSTAAVVAMALPWLLHRLSVDPAFGSGPLATVIQDLLSILIYLSVARALV
jgi:magnesium transporter